MPYSLQPGMQQTSKDLVAPFSAQNHLHAHGLYFATQQIHRGACSDSGDIVGLEVVNDLRNGV